MKINFAKNFIFTSIFSAFIFFSCENEDVITNNEPNTKEVWVEDGMLAFKDINAFVDYTLMASKLTNDERTHLEDSVGFVSMQSYYDIAQSEFDSLNSYSEYLEWENLNNDLWSFTEVENEGAFFLPIKRAPDAVSVNQIGKLKIANKVHDLKNNNDIFYSYFNSNTLKSTIATIDECRKTKDHRRVKSYIFDYGKELVFEVNAYKYSLWKWRSYETRIGYTILGYNSSYLRPKKFIVTRAKSANDYILEDFPIGCPAKMSADGKGYLRLYFENPGNYSVEIKGWSTGVPESSACSVHYN